MRRRFLRKLFCVAIFAGSVSGIAIGQTAPAPARSDPEMTLYRNGRIYTNDPSDPWAVAMLVRGEEIIAVGDEDEVGVTGTILHATGISTHPGNKR